MKEVYVHPDWMALVDDEDYELVSQYTWHIHKGKYAATHKRVDGKHKSIRMHRMILGLTDPRMEVDHINGDGLDNQKANLRVCTHAENLRARGPMTNNTSGFRGVVRDKGKWIARISFNGKPRHLGSFMTPEEAAVAYDRAAVELHGEFARLNFAVNNVSAVSRPPMRKPKESGG